MKKIYVSALVIGLIFMLGSCKRYLDEKPRQSLNVPSKLEDLQALMDNTTEMSIRKFGSTINEGLADDYYITYSSWQNAEFDHRQNYIWAKEAYDLDSWQIPYVVVYNSNVVLDALLTLNETNDVVLKNTVEGSALYFRAFAFYHLTQLYCKPYSSTADKDLGIVLRQTSAVEAKSTRATVAETYAKILQDLNIATELLPDKSGYITRPSKSACYALLARVYLNMRDYENALKFAERAMDLQSTLLDFNTLNLAKSPILPVSTSNPEIIFFSSVTSTYLSLASVAKIDTNLYRSYSSDDLRKSVFFLQNTGANAGTYRFNGSYYRLGEVFTGPTTAEMYLIKAECLARKGNTTDAMTWLNALLSKRYKRANFVAFTASNANEAKSIILKERRKELVFRGQRWSDLRRLNLEEANISLKRVLNGITYTLAPNDPTWVALIPLEEINRTGIPQNAR